MLVLCPSSCQRMSDFSGQGADAVVFPSEDDFSGLAEDLFFLITQKFLRCRSPTQNMPVGIHDKKGIILNVVHQNAEHLTFPGVWSRLILIDHFLIQRHCSESENKGKRPQEEPWGGAERKLKESAGPPAMPLPNWEKMNRIRAA